MRRMSFALTIPQYRDGSKTVTRRMGWVFLVPGDHVMAIVKGMGLKKGERQQELGPFEVLSVRRESVNAITQADVVKEGFPDWNRDEFIDFFCKHNRCPAWTVITRVEFKRLED